MQQFSECFFQTIINGVGVSQTSKRYTQSNMYHLSIEISFSDSTITLDYYRQCYCDSSPELLCASLKCRGNFPHRLHFNLSDICVSITSSLFLPSFFFKRARVLKNTIPVYFRHSILKAISTCSNFLKYTYMQPHSKVICKKINSHNNYSRQYFKGIVHQ